MICLIGLLCGFINGIFSSGAGQIFIFYFIFIKKYDTKKMRCTSILILTISSIISIFGYFNIKNINMIFCLIILILSFVSAKIGNFFIKKMNSDVLNLLSGIILVCFTIYKAVVM